MSTTTKNQFFYNAKKKKSKGIFTLQFLIPKSNL